MTRTANRPCRPAPFAPVAGATAAGDGARTAGAYTRNGYTSKFTVTADVVRWCSNDRCPPADVMLEMLAAGVVSAAQVAATEPVREQQTAASLAEYREARLNHIPSDEELYEMRAALGAGQTVVNLIAGQTYTTQRTSLPA